VTRTGAGRVIYEWRLIWDRRILYIMIFQKKLKSGMKKAMSFMEAAVSSNG